MKKWSKEMKKWNEQNEKTCKNAKMRKLNEMKKYMKNEKIEKTENIEKWWKQSRKMKRFGFTRKIIDGCPGVAARIQRKSRGWQSSWTQRLTRQLFSWSIFRAHIQDTWGFGWAPCLYSFPSRPKFARSVRGPKLQGPCRRRNGGAVPRAENFGDLITADHKVLSGNCESRNNHRYAIVVRIWPLNGCSRVRVKQKLRRKHKEACKSSWSQIESLKHLHWQFPGIWQSLWRSFLESLYVNTAQIRNEWDCWKSSAQSKGRHFCRVVAIRSEWKMVGKILWNVIPICEMLQICYLMGKSRMRDVLGNHVEDRLFHLVHWLSITQKLRRTSQESINLERKSYLDCSSETHCTRVEIGRVTYWLQTLRSWKRWTHRKSTRKDSMRMRWFFPKRRGIIVDGRIKPLGGDQDLRSTNSRRKSRGFSWRIRRVSSTTSRLISGCRWSDKWL